MESIVFRKADTILQYHETSTVSEGTQVPQETAGKRNTQNQHPKMYVSQNVMLDMINIHFLSIKSLNVLKIFLNYVYGYV